LKFACKFIPWYLH